VIKDSILSDECRARFEQMGEWEVRMLIATTHEFGDDTALAHRWLEEKDQEARLRNEALQAEQRQIARTTKNVAIAAAVLAGLGLVISALAWLYPLH
jgi:hypothetical protein